MRHPTVQFDRRPSAERGPERALNECIALKANPRLKSGPVTEKDPNSFQADVVTRDGSVVQRFIVDRGNGKLTRVEDAPVAGGQAEVAAIIRWSRASD